MIIITIIQTITTRALIGGGLQVGPGFPAGWHGVGEPQSTTKPMDIRSTSTEMMVITLNLTYTPLTTIIYRRNTGQTVVPAAAPAAFPQSGCRGRLASSWRLPQ